MKEISILDLPNIKIGHATDPEGGTGCTVLLFGEHGAPTAVDVRGGGPASRETELLSPVTHADRIHAVLLSGGSAFGLDAAGGVMNYLEERNIGVDTGIAKVPLVCESCIFDLVVGSPKARPGIAMGYEACRNAETMKKENPFPEGNVGAGTGATVGKYRGLQQMMKSGLGTYAVQIGDLQVAALVVVNAMGDIFDPAAGKQIAGLLTSDQTGFLSTEEAMYEDYAPIENLFTGNTTIGIILTNAAFRKTELMKIASMAHNGYARTICPVHTMADGDSIYAASLGTVPADLNIVGTLSAKVMEQAVLRAVFHAESAYGLPAAKDFIK